MPRSVWMLMLFSSLVMCTSPYLALVGGILGHQLSPSERFTTLPIACFVVGAALSVYPSIRLMGVWGRKKVLLYACGISFAGCILAFSAVVAESFVLLIIATVVLGAVQSTFAQVRFAAMELVDGPLKPVAASRIMLAGLVAAILGPELSRLGLEVHPRGFAGGFLLLACLACVAALVLYWNYQNHFPPNAQRSRVNAVPISRLGAAFWLAIVSAAIAYGVMSLIMTATPLTMHVHNQFSLIETKEVIQAHIVAMFLPSLFSGWLVSRIGPLWVIFVGVLCFALTLTIALSGIALMHFGVALVLLGVGWNFMFVAATGMLPVVSAKADPFRVQAMNDFAVVVCQACAALGAGWLLHVWGWEVLLFACVPLLVICVFLLVWVKMSKFRWCAVSGQ